MADGNIPETEIGEMGIQLSNMTSLFQQIEELIPTLPGWTKPAEAQCFAAIVIALRPKITVEIGVFGGRSFFGFALAHKFLGHGMAIGIDPWSNAAAVEGYVGENLNYWKNLNLDNIHDEFLRSVQKASVSNVVKIVRKTSGAAEVPEDIGLLHIDGQHTEQAVKDVRKFACNVITGGLVIMDDLEWRNESDTPVRRAVMELQKLDFDAIYNLGTGCVFQRR